jgi:predicted DsbA family dithiol-disulfide isomerase
VRIDRLKKEYEIKVKWSAFPLHPETPEEGLTLQELFAGRNVDIPAMQQHLKRVADSLGLPLSERTKTYNSRLAQELVKWAEAKGKGEEFHRAVFRAFFVETKNIAKTEDLVDLAMSVGLHENEALQVIKTRAFREAVDADWKRAYLSRLTAVPTFVLGEQRITGFQPYEALENFLDSCGVKKKAHTLRRARD